ncbi:MAG TPA: 4-(cytidine 5'-diphospho)-2-C-methyl-D-erythritol kinase [Lachnospiraceae bacterium]|nr:4-(cytidine 5'-diphospho)-2-C-methyl-D-erythritol kinase [Lachnospiraceae bacterium]
MNMIEKKAYGKVNLGLDITGRREDGYHLVRMVMQSVDIFDTLTFERVTNEDVIEDVRSDESVKVGSSTAVGSGNITNKPSIIITATNDPSLSLGEDNLIYKAARLLMDRFSITDGVRISLTKEIPIAAGMAGGSSDCAATLKGINELFELGLGEEELREIGVTLGADVPYCIMGGTALSEGIGEILTRLPDIPKVTFLIAKPEFGISTKEAYGAFDSILEDEVKHPDIDGMVEAVRSGDLSGITQRLGNVLEQASIPAHPQIDEIKKIMVENGAEAALMSGSGPTVFGIFAETENGRNTETDTAVDSAEKIVSDRAWAALEKLRESGLAAELFVARPAV